MTRLLALLLLLAGPVAAQDFPPPLSPYVSDFADLLDPGTEARITAALTETRGDPGTEVTVVTLRSRADFGDTGTLEAFATGLFNAWGVGDAGRNDGILILVVSLDQEMRIELGAGYPAAWDTVAENVIDNNFLPAFREGDFAGGIEAGTYATLDRIARPFALNRPPETGRSWLEWVIEGPGAMIAMLAALGALVFRRKIADLSWRLRKCPNCGRRFLNRSRDTLDDPTATAPGHGVTRVTCGNCDYESRTSYTIPFRTRSSSSSSGGSFGGGSSSGGGASGRW